MNDLKSIELYAWLDEASYRRVSLAPEWPVFRLSSIMTVGDHHTANFVSIGADAEQTPAVYVDGKLVNFGSTLYITGGPNDGREVKVVGFNLESEPIVQAADGKALEWPQGHRRHVLDVPVYRLSWDKPLPTLLEAAEAVTEAAKDWGAIGWMPGKAQQPAFDLIDSLRAAVEREYARPF